MLPVLLDILRTEKGIQVAFTPKSKTAKAAAWLLTRSGK